VMLRRLALEPCRVRPVLAHVGSLVTRVRRHFLDIQFRVLTDRFEAGCLRERPLEVGHLQDFTCVRSQPPQHVSTFSASISAGGSMDPMLHR
jgi:hypothetical protein